MGHIEGDLDVLAGRIGIGVGNDEAINGDRHILGRVDGRADHVERRVVYPGDGDGGADLVRIEQSVEHRGGYRPRRLGTVVGGIVARGRESDELKRRGIFSHGRRAGEGHDAGGRVIAISDPRSGDGAALGGVDRQTVLAEGVADVRARLAQEIVRDSNLRAGQLVARVRRVDVAGDKTAEEEGPGRLARIGRARGLGDGGRQWVARQGRGAFQRHVARNDFVDVADIGVERRRGSRCVAQATAIDGVLAALIGLEAGDVISAGLLVDVDVLVVAIAGTFRGHLGDGGVAGAVDRHLEDAASLAIDAAIELNGREPELAGQRVQIDIRDSPEAILEILRICAAYERI